MELQFVFESSRVCSKLNQRKAVYAMRAGKEAEANERSL